jgi:hypothetical protein
VIMLNAVDLFFNSLAEQTIRRSDSLVSSFLLISELSSSLVFFLPCLHMCMATAALRQFGIFYVRTL